MIGLGLVCTKLLYELAIIKRNEKVNEGIFSIEKIYALVVAATPNRTINMPAPIKHFPAKSRSRLFSLSAIVPSSSRIPGF